MRNDINNLKEMLNSFSKNKGYEATIIDSTEQTEKSLTENNQLREIEISNLNNQINSNISNKELFSESIEENLSLETQEMNIIKKALEKYNGKRSLTAKELGISERTLYRKIKQYDL